MHGRIIKKLSAYAIVALIFLGGTFAKAQFPTSNSLSLGRLQSPEIGSLQGIEQFGGNLRTDPDPGVGYTFRVLPPIPEPSLNSEQLVWALAHLPDAFLLRSKYVDLANALANPEEDAKTQNRKVVKLQAEIAELQLGLKLALGSDLTPEEFNRYASGRDTAAGMRLPLTSALRSGQLNGLVDPSDPTGFGSISPFAIAIDDGTLTTDVSGVPPTIKLYRQPLIQVKVRLVQVSRLGSSEFRSILDYVSGRGTPTSRLINGNNINANRRITRAGTSFPNGQGLRLDADGDTGPLAADSLANIAGNGALVNLTTEHLNLLTTVLATDFNGDVLTVPEVVTMNGQNVEFVSGAKVALPIGLTLTQGNADTTQEFFFKHVGTLLSVTPRIVNWRKHLEGMGEAPLVAQEVMDWNRLAAWMKDDHNILIKEDSEDTEKNRLKARLGQYSVPGTPLPIEAKDAMLAILEQYPTTKLRQGLYKFDIEFNKLNHSDGATLQVPSGSGCDWNPEDCTIDVELLVQQSSLNNPGGTQESVVAETAVANVIQVKSGHGAVLGGIIGTNEVETIAKVPLLGDIPVVGYWFRSKAVDRVKTELIIMVEATVLPNTAGQREETAEDFELGQRYVQGGLRDNPLEDGMFRAGFSSYLPPISPHETDFWKAEHRQKLRRVATEIDDLFLR